MNTQSTRTSSSNQRKDGPSNLPTAQPTAPLIYENLPKRNNPCQKYIWQPESINIWAETPCNPLQSYFLQEIRRCLETQGSIFLQTPNERTYLGPTAHLVIRFSANMQEEVSPIKVLGPLPKPRGTVLTITTIDQLPNTNAFDIGRQHLVRKASNIGLIIEGSSNSETPTKALWSSMHGNYRPLDYNENFYDNLTLRIQAHTTSKKVNTQETQESDISWQQWRESSIHFDIFEAGHRLGRVGIIEDKIPLQKYASQKHVYQILKLLNIAALGEGMRSQLDPKLRVMGITKTGGGKVNVNPNPMAGHIIPITKLTQNGYVVGIQKDCPTVFSRPSVETHENGLIYLAGALINAGLVTSFDNFIRFLNHHFSKHKIIDILPRGLKPKVLAIEHFHGQPNKDSIKNPSTVEIVYPDETRFPQVDFPCGARESAFHLLSALFQSKTFLKPGPLKKVIIAILPGHGSVAVYGGHRTQLTDVLINGMKMEEVQRI